MTKGYVRPTIEPREFQDENGQVIPYGSRWGGESPPEDMYSVVSNQVRFAPIVEVVEALIEYLAQTFDVTVTRSTEVNDDMDPIDSDRPSVEQVCRIIPRQWNAAPMTVTISDFPSVSVNAGFFFERGYPSCGCDACDEEWIECVSMMESEVFNIVEGRLTERIIGRRVHVALVDHDRSSETEFKLKDHKSLKQDLKRARTTLSALTSGWQPWTRNMATSSEGGQ